jgi:Uma2 family endonuclease
MTEEEYLQAERRSSIKSEWRKGRVLAMSGGSPRHNLIAGNVLAALKAALRGRRCLVLPSDQRVHVAATGTYTYPDVTVTCEKPQFHAKDRDSLTNPKVVVEVLSRSTEAHDRGAKFADSQSIPSLQEYVIVAQAERRVEHFRKLETGQWLLTVIEGDGVLALPGLDCQVPLAEIYADLELLDEAGESPAPPSAVTSL